MQTVTIHTNKCFNLYHISLINVTLCSSYCQYFQFLPLKGYICNNNNLVTPTQLNNITTHATYKLYTVIGLFHQLSVTVIAYHTQLCIKVLPLYIINASFYIS